MLEHIDFGERSMVCYWCDYTLSLQCHICGHLDYLLVRINARFIVWGSGIHLVCP